MDRTDAPLRPTEDELRLFSERIGRLLADRPVDLDPAAHRERLAGLMRLAGEGSFYQLLGLAPTAALREVHEAYDRLAGLAHPANAARLGLEGREGVLEMLFERLTQAYLTLSQPERRKPYDRELGGEVWSAPDAGRRQEEARGMAQHYHDRALERIGAGDYHFAVELLQQAVRSDDGRADSHALLGKIQAKNSRWLRSAAENLQRAVELGSRDLELPAALRAVRERLAAGEALGPPTADDPRRRGAEQPDVEVLDSDADEIDVPLPPGKRGKG